MMECFAARCNSVSASSDESAKGKKTKIMPYEKYSNIFNNRGMLDDARRSEAANEKAIVTRNPEQAFDKLLNNGLSDPKCN